jgi:hypothetical protein
MFEWVVVKQVSEKLIYHYSPESYRIKAPIVILGKVEMEEKLIAPCGMNCGICSGYLALKHDIKSK